MHINESIEKKIHSQITSNLEKLKTLVGALINQSQLQVIEPIKLEFKNRNC